MIHLTRRSLLVLGAASVAGCTSAAAPLAEGATNVTASELITLDAACGDEESASVSVTDDVVTIEGALTAINPCHDAVLEDVSVAGDQLVVTVGTASTGEDICIECIGRIEYEVTVTVADLDAIESVRVRHESGESFTHDVS